MILADGSIVRFAPQLAFVQANRVSLGQTISVSGMGVQNQYGRVLEVQSLASN